MFDHNLNDNTSPANKLQHLKGQPVDYNAFYVNYYTSRQLDFK